MKIGATRVEEAKVFDGEAGYHQFHDVDGEAYGYFEVFWVDGEAVIWEDDEEEEENISPGWYWRAGGPTGPFSSSYRARCDADPEGFDQGKF